MNQHVALIRSPACRFCSFLARNCLSAQRSSFPGRKQSLGRPAGAGLSTTNPPTIARFRQPSASKAVARPLPSVPSSPSPSPGQAPLGAAEAAVKLREVESTCQAIVSTQSIPAEGAILEALRACESLARRILGEPVVLADGNCNGNGLSKSSTSALLSLNGQSSKSRAQASGVPLAAGKVASSLSGLAYSIIRHPPVFISAEVLESYVRLQSLLSRPKSLPEAFVLYSTKRIPKAAQASGPVTYTQASPSQARYAIPRDVAMLALNSAIAGKSLGLALSIIDLAFCAPAYKRSLLIRKMLPPAVGAALLPLCAYTVASFLSQYQDSMDTALATNIAFAGILAYVGFTAFIGAVAVTTSNDQMDRVTWATGLPLRQRWLREDERAAVDRVAGAWGFKETWRRGEEEGEEWEALRDWIGSRGMVLDRPELMEGME
ncbi:MAG: hypothetical protein M1829_005781 [Trizodia sp. TS-e1964]|nr:MAG: hypothetical protein M1829_005781 [Trizodia sp. TS-e1964]